MPLSVVDILFRAKGTNRIKRQVRGIKSSLGGAAKMAGALVAPLAGLAAGAGLAMLAKDTMKFDKALTQLSIQGHVTAAGQADLREQIVDVATTTGIARDQVLQFTQGIVDATGDMQLGQDAMMAVAKAAQVTGADMQGLGTLVSDAFLKFGISGKDAESTLSTLIEQGEKGRYTLNEMAQTGARAMSVAGLAGMKGVEGMREMGAMMQIIRQGFGSAEEAATGFKVMVTKIYSSESKRKLEAMSVALRDPETGKLRKFGDVFLDILRASKGDAMVLSDLFGTRGIMGVQNFRDIMEKNGGSIEAVTAEIDKYRNVTGSAAALQGKFNRAAGTSAVTVEKVGEEFKKLIDENLLTPDVLNALAESLGNLSTSTSFLTETASWWREKLGLGKDKDEGAKASQRRAEQYEKVGKVAGTVLGGPMGFLLGRKIGQWAGERHVASVARAGWGGKEEIASRWAGLANIGAGAQTQTSMDPFFGEQTAFQQALGQPETKQTQNVEGVSGGLAGGPVTLLETLNVQVSVLGAEGADVSLSDQGGKLLPGAGKSL